MGHDFHIPIQNLENDLIRLADIIIHFNSLNL